MIRWVLYIFFLFVSIHYTVAQSQPDTVKTIPHSAQPVTSSTVQPAIANDSVKITAPTTNTVAPTQSLPTQTITAQPKQKKFKKPVDPNKKIDFKRANKELIKLYKDTFERKQEIVLQNKRYRIYNNYLSVGVGQCYNSGWAASNPINLCTAFDFNFHARKNCFQVGGNLIGPALWDNSCIQLHAGWGYRIERCNYMLAAYGGLSFSDGYYLQATDTIPNKLRMNAVGGYAALQAYYKIKFDYGVGLSTFFDINSKQSVLGIKVELFFSGAYKGFKKINYAKEDEKYQVP